MSLTGMCSQSKNSQQGFTLLEAMIVVAIIGVLAAVAYPSMQSQLAQSRVNSAKSSLAAAFKDAQAQSLILRKPVWITFEQKGTQLFVVLTATEPNASGDVLNFISKTALPKTIRFVNDSGTDAIGDQLSTLRGVRVTPAGNFEVKNGSRYAPSSHNFTFCDTAHKKMVVKPVRFQTRSVPIPSSSTSLTDVTCNLS